MDGNFSLTVKEGAILVVSYVGYITQDLPVKNKSTLVVHLKEDSQALGEVVVTALGIKREEKALGYSVQKMSGDDMPMAKSVDITTSLTGKIAGLNIQNNTEFDQDATISLRGSTPLLIVDGIPYANLSINEIAADDIESVDVLKGATASALYGARGSSGAIMITTKKGSDKEGLNINVNSNTMFSPVIWLFLKHNIHTVPVQVVNIIIIQCGAISWILDVLPFNGIRKRTNSEKWNLLPKEKIISITSFSLVW